MENTISKRLLSFAIALIMVLGMVPFNAMRVLAADAKTDIDLSQGAYTVETAGDYIVSNYTGANTLTVQADANITLEGVNITAPADTSAISIVSGNVTLNVTADSTLIGGDNGAGIYVAEAAALTVKGGKLTAIGNNGTDDASGAAGIGGTWTAGNSGSITIDGAVVTAMGYGSHGSGIGSGSGEVVGEIKIINGSEVTAQGGYYVAGGTLNDKYGKTNPEGGAAIGGGGKTASTVAPITISHSKVTAYGGSKAAGIGANFWSSVEKIDIDASEITAYGGASSAGIGTSRAGDSGVSAVIEITDSTVNATGGHHGAGIGCGYNGDSVSNLPETTITIDGNSVVNATGVNGGAGIGGGYKTNNVSITIADTADVTATAGILNDGSNKTIDQTCASAIGSGANGSGSFVGGTVTIEDTAKVAVNTVYGGKAAIEGGVSGENITVNVSGADLVINTAAELRAFAEAVNGGDTYSDKVVLLAADIDLAGSETNLWTPIGPSGDSGNKFYGTFDGQGHTIKNLYVKQNAAYHAAGLFGATCGTVKNLTIDGAYVESLSSGSATVNGTAVLAGSTAYGATIENVHVKNATVKGNRYVAGIVGYMDGSVIGCSVEDLTLIATPDDLTGSYDNGDKVGGIVGYCNSNAVEVSGCELKGTVSITAYRDVAGVVGCASTGVKINNNTNSAALTITVDQITNSYGEKTANASEFVGRNTPAEATGNTQAEGASCTITEAEAPSGTITFGYTCADGVWGEASANASESFYVELYVGDTKIATTQLNNIGGIIDGDVYVTWSIPFAGSVDEYWTVTWEEGYPDAAQQPTKVVLYCDGEAVAENAVQMNAPDDLNPVVWEDVVNAATMPIQVTYADGTVEYFDDMLEAVPYTSNCPRLEGATIKLLKDVTGKGMRFMETGMVLDLNGHTFTINNATGSSGTNTSGFQIRADAAVATIKNGTIQVAAPEDMVENTNVVWMFNSYSANFIVEDVTVDCANMAYSYGSSVYTHVSRSGDNTQFLGDTKFINFNSEVAGAAINVGGTMTIADTVVSGGSIELDSGAALTAAEGLDVIAAEDCKLVYADGTYTAVPVNYVAQVGETKYESLQDAINAADGGTVTLLTDVDMGEDHLTVAKGQTVTLELAGYIISGEQKTTATKNDQLILNNGTLTVQDSSDAQTGTITFAYSGEQVYLSLSTISNSCGTLTVKSGTITNTTDKANHYAFAFAIDNLTNSSIGAATVNIEGGAVTSEQYRAIRQFANSTTTANTVNVTGGTVAGGTDEASTTNIGIWLQSPNNNSNLAAMNVTGGQVSKIYIDVNDGAGKADQLSVNVSAECCSEFQTDLPEGYVLEQSNGTYGLVKKTYVAQIGETKYETLAEALAAAKEGETVTILASTSETIGVPAADNVTITAAEGVVLSGGVGGSYCNKSVTLDGLKFVGGKGIALTSSVEGVTYTVKNCSFDGVQATAWKQGVISLNGKANVVIENNTITNVVNATEGDGRIESQGQQSTGVYISGAKDATVTGNTISAVDGTGINIACSGTMTATNNTISDWGTGALAKNEGRAIRTAGGTDVTITGNVMIDNGTAKESFVKATGATALDASANYWNGSDPMEGNIFESDKSTDPALILQSYYTDAVKSELVNIAPSVAQIGDTYYETLQEALDAAAAGTGAVTVEILCDIDLTDVDWNPVTVSAPGYPVVTVNGNNKSITGLNDMLFAGTWAGGSGLIINDLTIKDSTIVNDENDAKGTVGVGAFIGYPQASATITLSNCHLVNSTVKGGHWTGGLIGMAGGYNGNDGPVFMDLTITGCSVTDSTITGKGSVGGVIGHGSCAAWTNVVIEDTTVTGNTITSTGSSNVKAGVVMGTIGAAGQETTAAGETKTGGAYVAVTESGNTVTSNGTAITTIYGRQGTSTGVLTVTGGSYENYPIEENVSYAAPAAGYLIQEGTDGTYVLAEDPAYGMVAKIGDTYYETLAEALEAAEAETDIVIDLVADATLDITAWQDLAIGGESTETITINGNGNTLTFNKKNSDWNHITTNNGAKLILNDMTITDSGYNNGPWNRYDLNFACPVELNNVTATKAIALKAEAKLTDVTINETGDNYAIWIQPNGQSVEIDGLTVTSAGRGIKIDDQYVDEAQKVTLSVSNATFATSKKAAILVKSPAGADITLADVDISGVAVDTVNAVWNDEDAAAYYGLITVTGGTKAQEGEFVASLKDKDGNIIAYYADLAEAFTAAQDGDEVVILSAGTYTLSTSGKDITITGDVDGVVFDNIGKKNMGDANVTFNNVTFDYYPNVNYTGLQHSGDLVYNNCTFNGQVFLYGTSETFNNCTFNQDSADAYNVWTYSAKQVAFEGCTFNCAGKSVLIYCENGALYNEVSVTDCDFVASAPVEGKAAIEMDSSLTAGIDLTIDGETTTTGFGTGNVSGNSLWNNKKDNKTEANNDITVTVDGDVVLQPMTAVAKIGNNQYYSLAEALEAATDGDTVTLLTDVKTTGKITITKAITIDGNGHSIIADETATWYTVSGKLNIKNYKTHLLGVNSDNVTLKNIVLDNNNLAAGINVYQAQNVVFDNVDIANSSKGMAALTVNASDLTIKTKLSTGEHATAIDIGNGSTVVVEPATVFETNKHVVKFDAASSAAGTDLTGAVKADGTPYFAAIDSAEYYTEAQLNTSRATSYSRSLKLLTDVTVTTDISFSGSTLDLNGNDLTVEEGKLLKITGNVTITGEGTVSADIQLAAGKTLTASADLDVTTVDGYKVVYEDGVYTAVEIVYVAQIGETKYETIAEAMAAAQDGETVMILAGEYDAFSVNKAITVVGETDAEGNNLVKLNGKLSVTGTGVTVKNLNVNNSSERALYVSGGDILIEGCNLTGVHGLRYCYAHNGDVTLKDCVITGSTYGVHFDAGNGEGNVIIDGCTITGWTSFGSAIEGVTITDTTFCDGNYDVLRFYQSATLEGCTFSPATTIDFGKNEVRADLNNCSVSDGSALTDVVYLGDIANMGVQVYEDGELIVVEAKIGDTYYLTLEEAVTAAQDGDTVTVLVDVSVTDSLLIESDITLDLNGFTVSAEGLSSKPVIRVLADVTVTGGTVDGTTGTNSYAFIVGNSETAGTLNIADGTYKGVTSAVSITNGTANISGGTFSTAHDGEGTDYGAQYLLNCMDAAYKAGTAVYKITGGTFLGFNPENNAAEGAKTNFTAEGYGAVYDGSSKYTVAKTPELPAATITMHTAESLVEADAPKLTFAMNFLADEATQEQLDYYGNWYADFVLTVNKKVTFNADSDTADGYLAGQYDFYGDEWLAVPFEDVTLEAGQSLKIMEYAAYLMGSEGLKFTYEMVYDFVKDFDCGIYFTPEFLAANPDLEVTLELRMYNNADETVSEGISELYTYTTPVAVIESEEKAVYFDTMDAALAAAQAGETVTMLTDAVLSAAAVKPGVTVDLNGCALTGDVIATLDINGGTYTTTMYAMAGGEGFLYETTDAVIEMASMNEITVKSGTITLGQSWRTLAGQKLTIATDAAFVIPADTTMEVNCTVIADGTLTVDGEIQLTDPAASVKAAQGLNVTTELEGYLVEYIAGAYVLTELGDRVAQNTVTGTFYNDVAVALNEAVSGQTVILLTDVSTDSMLMVMDGITLDLNGNTLQVNNYLMAAFSDSYVIDSSEDNSGLLAISLNKLRMLDTNPMLPIAVDGGYKFVEVELYQHWSSYGDFEFWFDSVDQLLLDQYAAGRTSEDMNISIQIEAVWDGGSQLFDFDESVVSAYIAKWDVNSLYLNIKGTENVTGLKYKARVVFGSGTLAEVAIALDDYVDHVYG